MTTGDKALPEWIVGLMVGGEKRQVTVQALDERDAVRVARRIEPGSTVRSVRSVDD